MRRIIEELIEKRKQQQVTLKKILEEVGQLIQGRGFFGRLPGKNKKKISETLLDFNQALNE
ncbi:hypothetical protein ACFLRT_02420, partial [Acidobacteriota bacterium]